MFCMLLGFVCKVEAYKPAGGRIDTLVARHPVSSELLYIACNKRCVGSPTGVCQRYRDNNYMELVSGTGLTPYKCVGGAGWSVDMTSRACSGNVEVDTTGHVWECVNGVGDFCAHQNAQVDTPQYWSLAKPGDPGCYQRKCAEYAILDGRKCKRNQPKWLVVGNVAYKCGDTDFDARPVVSSIDGRAPKGKEEVVVSGLWNRVQCMGRKKYVCTGSSILGYYWKETEEKCCAEGQALVNGNCVAKECETPGADVGVVRCPKEYEYATDCKELCTEDYKKKIEITKCGYPYKVNASRDKCEIIENYVEQSCRDDTVPLPDKAVRGRVVSSKYGTNGVACWVDECESGWHVNEATKAECLKDIVEETNTESPAGSGETAVATLAETEPTSQVEAVSVAEVSETAEETSGDTTEVPVATSAAPSGTADGDPCTMSGAEIAEYRGGKCVAMKCLPGFKPDGDNCAEISGPCESLPDNATRGHRQYDAETESVKCIITDCVDGYVVADDKLSCHEDYKALAEQAREREQSTGNKLLGAVGMGATGIGGSMLLSGMSETKSDDEAEIAMKAYLSTFTCKYGNEHVSGGTKNVEIPGGNELIQMYAEYVALANDLKVRKEALGMKPGIESEAILDSATSGLYDDVSTGKTKGVYASLARALSDPNSEDAKLWAAQREESDEKKKTGAIVAGIGAIGSLLGDIAINKIDWKAKQKKVLRDLETSVANITPPKVRCPQGAAGVYAPNCDCKQSNQVYNVDMNRCDACPSGHVVVNGECKCPQNKHEVNGECVGIPVVENDEEVVVEDVVAEDVADALEDTAVLSADNLFEYGSAKLTTDAKAALKTFIDQLRDAGATVCKPVVKGYADPSGDKDVNKRLSEQRAKSVAEYLRQNSDRLINDVVIEHYGEAGCTCGLRDKVPSGQIDYTKDDYKVCKDQADGYSVSENNESSRYAPCRRVEITHGCKSGGGDLGGVISGDLGSVASTLTVSSNLVN